MKTIKKYSLTTAYLLSLCLALTHCSSGGSDSDGGDDGEFTVDACDSIGLKVANGEACQVDSNPAASPLVRLRITNPNGEEGVCSGTAIDATTVLTAAHCVLDGPDSIIIDTFAGAVAATSYEVAPDFSIGNNIVFNDVAIIKASSALNIATFPLLLSRAPQVGEEVVVAGFGFIDGDSEELGQIHAGNAFITDVTPNHIFIQYTGSQAHPCQGDSGGPLLVRQGGSLAIAGVVSQSDPTVETICEPGDITLYTNTQKQSAVSFITSRAGGAGGV